MIADSKQLLPTDLTAADMPVLNNTPKCVIFEIAKHLASQATEEDPDQSLLSGSYLDRFYDEWGRLHKKGIVSQPPPSR